MGTHAGLNDTWAGICIHGNCQAGALHEHEYSLAKLCPTLATPWTEAHQASLSMGFPRQEYWSGLPFASPGDLPEPGIKLKSPELAGGFFTTESPGKSFMSNSGS